MQQFNKFGDVASVRIAGIPDLRYIAPDHDPHPLVQSNFGANLRAPVLATSALGMADQGSER